MKTYREVRKDMAGQPESADAADELLPCEWCRAPTRRAVLSGFGARCGRCFGDYCRGAFAGAAPGPVSREEAARKLAQFVGR